MMLALADFCWRKVGGRLDPCSRFSLARRSRFTSSVTRLIDCCSSPSTDSVFEMEQVLKEHFGYAQFRSHQKEIVEKILDGRDCLVVMTTGSGKSLCYQIPPLVTRKTAIVISPLLSLMQDQVMSLKQRGIKGEYLGSTQTNKSVQSHAESGNYDVLYMTPEKACGLPSSFWSRLLKVGICLLAVDEAHCISEWGHDFRKEYKQLNVLRGVLSDVPFVALTATATGKVRNDIIYSLKMTDPFIAVGSLNRENLFYGVRSITRSLFFDELVQEVSKYIVNTGSTIIYCMTINDTEQVYKALQNSGIKACIYHGQMGSNDREMSHRSFIRDEVQVMVATVAFGMGIDKPNIRCVIHYGCPKNLESYYQESGRCGRDGLASVCLLYYSRSDFYKVDFYCGEAQSERRNAIKMSLVAAEKYCLLATCRRKYLLQYFGEEITDDCGNCDNCTKTKKERNLSRESFLLLSSIRSCGGRWGINMHVDILRGSRSKKIVENNFDKLPFHGLGKDYSSTWWKALAAQLMTHGFIKENIVDVYRTISVSLIGLQFLSLNTVDQTLILPLTTEMIDEEEHGSQQKKLGDFPNASILACEEFLEVEAKLFSMLLDVRFRLAKGDGIAPYAICGDETIKRLTKLRPQTRARLANIDGVNQHFLTRYGDEFISQIIKLSQELGLQTHCEGTPQIQATMARRINTNMEKKLTPAVADAWKMWQQNGMPFSEVAELARKSGPVKQTTVISYILVAAKNGCELNWPRFCKETGLTLEIVSQIRRAIKKIGARDRLKPIKEELPESVTYDNIKAFLTMEELGLSAEEMSGYDTRTDVPNKKMESSLNINLAITIRESAEPYCSMSAAAMASAPVSPCHGTTNTKQSRAEDSLHLEYYSPKKLQKVCENRENFGSDLVATKTAVLQWIMEHDKVGLEDIVKQFKGSKEESVLDLLACLECEFLIFKKNGLFQAM
ncbi:ATP-dependent DNA helicase RecQ-like isoform X2 [Zingiber officinale]|uniref:ATP-dependent DNA helicase RecQ-like isoform X2 n=1 Tax=Zingiber officinale TaxID=94328 RepID=UPI001C4B6B17|nr:ATP-dependent DNA helicase RecQ-like isoform X2 [Zingiber officinale]